MDDRIAAEILSAYTDRILQGQHGTEGLPYPGSAQKASLSTLLQLTENIQDVLVPIQPDPTFVRQLGKQLVATTSERRKAATDRTRKAVVVSAAVLGSAVSLASAIGLVVYLVRHRGRLHPGAAVSQPVMR